MRAYNEHVTTTIIFITFSCITVLENVRFGSARKGEKKIHNEHDIVIKTKQTGSLLQTIVNSVFEPNR